MIAPVSKIVQSTTIVLEKELATVMELAAVMLTGTETPIVAARRLLVYAPEVQ